MLFTICFFSLLDPLSPCLTGTWLEAAMLTVVVRYMSTSQSVDQMELRTLTPAWLAVLIVAILALGWVYFTTSCTVVNPTSCEKDVLEVRGKHMTSVSPFQETSSNLQNTPDTNPEERKLCKCIIFPPGWLAHLGIALCFHISSLLLCIWCQLSATWWDWMLGLSCVPLTGLLWWIWRSRWPHWDWQKRIGMYLPCWESVKMSSGIFHRLLVLTPPPLSE